MTTSAAAALARSAGYPSFPEAIPPLVIEAGRYVVRFATGAGDLDAVQRLRFAVFNLEMGEGLDTSFATGRDADDLDHLFHHLVIETRSGEVVGTYRMQTGDMARAHRGFYSAGEFDLSRLPDALVEGSVEIGRACVDAAHRNGRVVHLLWRGLAVYLSWNRKRHLFGCCSLPTQDPLIARRTLEYLDDAGYIDHGLHCRPRPDVDCLVGLNGDPLPRDVTIPPLFEGYLHLGARVCARPAIDRLFKTIDFLVFLDTDRLNDRTRQTFFRDSPAVEAARLGAAPPTSAR